MLIYQIVVKMKERCKMRLNIEYLLPDIASHTSYAYYMFRQKHNNRRPSLKSTIKLVKEYFKLNNIDLDKEADEEDLETIYEMIEDCLNGIKEGE